MKRVRLGIVGMGNIGRHHAEYLLSGQVTRGELVAVCRDRSGDFKNRGLKIFSEPSELIHSGLIDALIIATPHYQHTTLGIAALKAGLHVLVEKPISAHKADAERLLAVRRDHPGQVFGAMFQMRCEPRYLEIKRLLSTGQLGKMIRFSWLVTDWFRSEAYYASSAWRATWKGEGGGVLINQCLHQLDLLQWLLGMPSRVRSFVQLGRFHNIEVEDSVTAYLSFPGSADGVFIASTGEAPGTNRFEIAGTLGKIVLEGDKLTLTRNAVSSTDQIQTARLGFGKPEASTVEKTFPDEPARHAAVTQNFIDSIVDGIPLIAPGEEGIFSLELANALLYSGLTDQTIDLPLDSEAYRLKLQELTENSSHQKQVREVSSEDFGASFQR